MLGFMLPTMFLSMWISNTATTAMMVGLFAVMMVGFTTATVVGLFRHDGWLSTAMMVGLPTTMIAGGQP